MEWELTDNRPIQVYLDYCNALLHGAPASSIQKLERVQSTAARIVQTTTATAPLTASPTADHIQVSRADIQDPPHGNTCLPQPSHHSACL